MIILEEEDNKSYLLNPKEEKTRVNLSSLNNSTCYTNYDQNILTITEEPYSYAIWTYKNFNTCTYICYTEKTKTV